MDNTQKALLGGAVLGGVALFAYLASAKQPEKEPIGYVERAPYRFPYYTEQEKIQLEDFLGINPPDVDIDTWLGRLSLSGLEDWRNYWIGIWTNLGRADLIAFTNKMYDKYKSKPPGAAAITTVSLAVI